MRRFIENARKQRGLTFVEILVVLMIMSIMTMAALPLLHHKYRGFLENELRRKLEMMRSAIDRYHEYAVLGQIEPPDLEWYMFPEDLEELVEGVEVKPSQDEQPITIKFLRRIPIDPMTGEEGWDCRGYEDDPDDRSSSCDEVYDVFSRSTRISLDGETSYDEW
jgi:general secretion pathway protein G